MNKFCVFCKVELPPDAGHCTSCHSKTGLLLAEPPNPPSAPLPAVPRAPIQVAGYRLSETLGAGGMGTVYLGERPDGSRAAIKMLRPKYTQHHDLVGRFLREAKTVSGLQHPNIVALYDYGLDPDHGYYLILEYLQGESLLRRLNRQGAFSPFHTAQILLRALNGLRAAHEKGIIHRDMKPANIFLLGAAEPPPVKLLDFGVAKLLHENSHITQTGTVLGTPEYMSPEQAFGKRDVDARADIYSVGVLLFELVTGRRPFLAPTPSQLLVKHQREQPPIPSVFAPGLPRELDELILACLEKDPKHRPPSVDALSNALRRMRSLLPDVPLSSLIASSSGDTTTVDTDIPDSEA